MPHTLFDKIWLDHTVEELSDGEYLLYIDRIFLHERTGSIAMQSLADQSHAIKNKNHVFCTIDHIVDTLPGRTDQTLMPSGDKFISSTRKYAKAAGINFFDIGDPRQGIVHVVSPEQGIALPGCIVVCPDSHTCTLGGVSALGWGIGSTDAEHAMATATLKSRKPKNMQVTFTGALQPGVTAKDMIMHLIGTHKASGGNGYAIEFNGDTIKNLAIEDRLTLCNMAVEFSAFSAIIAPDQKTFNYVEGRPFAPSDDAWTTALDYWQTLHSDAGAIFDSSINIDASSILPSVTWGTSPEHLISIGDPVPNPAAEQDPDKRTAMERALDYMDLMPGTKTEQIKIDAAFIGSCTNSRLSNLRAAAAQLKGKKIAPHVSAICVPGSTQVKLAAEKEGLDKIFVAAGFEWREAGCSMCFYAGGETFGEQQRIITSTNRNFEGRQGPGNRSHLASAVVVAASAIKGYISAPELHTSEPANLYG